MIKVNLLREHSAKTRKRIVASAPASRKGTFYAVLLIANAAGLGYWWHQVDNQVAGLKSEREKLQAASQQLAVLKREISRHEKLKKLHEGRIEVIERLKDSQTAPVLLLNNVIRSIPSNAPMWLTVLDQKGDRIQITGFSQRSESIPDFMTNLSRSGFFKTVDLELVQDEKDAAKFSLICTTTRKLLAE